jgi:LDH2 family malate/lactate/ureidoglycolate dehydrogenase
VFSLAIDIERFMPLNQFNELIQTYLVSIKGSKKGKGVSRIYIPGERKFEKEKQSLKEGVEVSEGLAKNLNTLLEKVKSPLRLT